MKKVVLFIGLIMLFLLNISCEKEIDLNAQTPRGQMYANAILNPDSIFRVFISYTTSITAPLDEIEDVLNQAEEALVIIKDASSSPIDTLEFVTNVYSGINSSFLVFESSKGLRPIANETYELYVEEAKIKNSKIISAQTKLPDLLPPIKARKSIPNRQVAGEDQIFAIQLEWKDPDPQKENLFIIEAFYRNIDLFSGISETIQSELYSVNSLNDNLEVGPPNGKFFYIFIDDTKIQNPFPDSIFTQIGVLADIFDQLDQAGTPFFSAIEIRVHHVSDDLYDYYQDVEKYRINSSGTDIFAQPVPVRGNIQGGLGILGAEIVQETILIYQ